MGSGLVDFSMRASKSAMLLPAHRGYMSGLPTVSVIIPAINEEDTLGACLASVSGEQVYERIVVDGGSTDRTTRIAKEHGAKVMTAPRGRARQMNAGASVATGDILLFLHADCRLAPGAVSHLRKLIADRRACAGYFRQRIDGRHPLFRLIELGSNLRARWLKRPYGDQAMFLRRSTFVRLGGFENVPILEDLILARALRREGPFLSMPDVVSGSARRWQRDGIVARVMLNWSVAMGEFWGTPLGKLAAAYQRRRTSPAAHWVAKDNEPVEIVSPSTAGGGTAVNG